MIIDKKELVKALEKIQKFTGDSNKGYPVLQTAWFDGDSQTIVANDLKAFAKIPVKMGDYIKSVKVDASDLVPVPDQKFADELKGMKAGQVKSLAEYAGVISTGKKQVMIEAIFNASVESAVVEQEAKSTQTISEGFCVNPGHLLRIVKAQDGENVELIPTD